MKYKHTLVTPNILVCGGDSYKYYSDMNSLARRNNKKPKVVVVRKLTEKYIPFLN